jgi:hypothetical protein
MGAPLEAQTTEVVILLLIQGPETGEVEHNERKKFQEVTKTTLLIN